MWQDIERIMMHWADDMAAEQQLMVAVVEMRITLVAVVVPMVEIH